MCGSWQVAGWNVGKDVAQLGVLHHFLCFAVTFESMGKY